MENKGNKFRGKRTPKKKETVRVEMNNPNAVNPELERRRNMSRKEFLAEMLEMIKVRKKQILEGIKNLRDKVFIQVQIKQSLDMLEILKIDFEHTNGMYQDEIKKEVLKHGKKDA